jgi:WD40 repeat protein
VGTEKTPVYSLAWSPDGQQLAVSVGLNKDLRVRLFDATGTPGAEVHGKTDIRCLAYSPDSLHLACAEHSGAIRIVSSSGQQEQILAGHSGEARIISWSKQGQIVSGGDDRALRCFDGQNGAPLWVAVALGGDDSVTIGGADGKPLGSLITAEKTLVYLVERAGGRIDVLSPLAFGKL